MVDDGWMREWCCRTMGESGQVAVSGEPETADRPVVYDSVFDEHRMVGAAATSPPLSHCPWCDHAFGPSRRDAWFQRLDQLGLTPDHDLPADLLSGDWWASAAQETS